MRKTLLIAAAALAASVISSQAQVYSQNIVGYVNSPVPSGYVNLSVPLDGASGNNSITNTINVFSGAYDGDLLNIWQGTHYAVYTIDSTVSTGIADAADINPVTPPVVNPGTGFFLQNIGASNNITWVGTVHVDGAGASTNVVGVTTNVVAVGNYYYASTIPVGGGVSSVLQLPNNGSLDGSLINIPNISGGSVHGFTTITIDSTMSTGFADAADINPVPEPTIPVGSGFFLQNITSGSVNWVQSF